MIKYEMTPEELDGKKVKPRDYKQYFPKAQVMEIAKCKVDPIYFIETYVRLKHPTLGALPFKMYDFQKNLIHTYTENVRCISMLSRQVGKTATAAAYLLWKAIFNNDYTILVSSKDQSGADEIMERLWFAYEELPWFLKPGVIKNDVKTKTFDNGSKIMSTATTKTSGRGKSPSLVYLDEFAFVPPNVAEEFWISIFASISTGGACIITSTPNSDCDKFASLWFSSIPSKYSDKWEDKLAMRYDAIQSDDEKYETIYETEEIEKKLKLFTSQNISDDDDDTDDELEFVSFYAHWTSVPEKINKKGKILRYRGQKFKNMNLKSGVSNEQWQREYECCFISGESTLISGTKLASLRATVKEPRFVDKFGVRWYEMIKPNTTYSVVMDPSGDGIGDDAAIEIWELPSLKQVAEWNDAESDQHEQAKMLWRILTRIDRMQNNMSIHYGGNTIYYSVERNSIGIGIIRLIENMGEERFPGVFIDATTASSALGEKMMSTHINLYRGLLTTVGSKKRYAQEFKQLVERNLFIVRSKFLSTQMKNFVKTGSSWAAKEGSKDDLIMACVLMCHLIDEIREQEPDLDDRLAPDIDDFDENDDDDPANNPIMPLV